LLSSQLQSQRLPATVSDGEDFEDGRLISSDDKNRDFDLRRGLYRWYLTHHAKATHRADHRLLGRPMENAVRVHARTPGAPPAVKTLCEKKYIEANRQCRSPWRRWRSSDPLERPLSSGFRYDSGRTTAGKKRSTSRMPAYHSHDEEGCLPGPAQFSGARFGNHWIIGTCPRKNLSGAICLVVFFSWLRAVMRGPC